MGFQNEKDHPEVAPSQFEINYGYGEVVAAADQIQLYKLICRQVATQWDLTACFLPKPVVGVNGSGMHTNVSISKNGKNLFWDPEGRGEAQQAGLGVCRPHSDAWQRHLPAAERRASMLIAVSIRTLKRRTRSRRRRSIAVRWFVFRSATNAACAWKFARWRPMPIRTWCMYSIFKTGLEGETAKIKNLRQAERYLPDNIYDALWTTSAMPTGLRSFSAKT